jgi:hypothetical protein
MSARHVLILALAALATAPLCVLVFGDGRAARQPPARAQATVRETLHDGCVERPLAYGLTNDQAVADQYARDLLSPFVPHPPLPRPGFYAPGRGPDQATLLHALFHGYVVVRYRPDLAAAVERDLAASVDRAAQPVVVVAGDRMPFAAGAVVYGRTSICRSVDRKAVGQLAAWIRSARPGRRIP